jgi:hypothetical protein
MAHAKRRQERKPKRRMPRDGEIREALIESGVTEGEAANAVSHLLRVFGLDFFRRRKNRLLNMVQDRLLVVGAKSKVVDVLGREGSGRQKTFNIEDLFTGVLHTEMVNLGEIVLRRAIRELVAEGVVKARNEGARMELISLTGRRAKGSGARLRDVYERMRLAMGIKGARPYLLERTFRL